MQVVDVPIVSITPADWNPNHMSDGIADNLRGTIQRFGWVVPLVVREWAPCR